MAPKTATLEPERIGDVDENFTPEATEVDELGLTQEERAEFDGMRDADKGVPEGPEDAAADVEALRGADAIVRIEPGGIRVWDYADEFGDG